MRLYTGNRRGANELRGFFLPLHQPRSFVLPAKRTINCGLKEQIPRFAGMTRAQVLLPFHGLLVTTQSQFSFFL